jgi:RNase H-fold protein (predicted Holliday junction resolvase)
MDEGTTYVGLDVHKRTIAVAAVAADAVRAHAVEAIRADQERAQPGLF